MPLPGGVSTAWQDAVPIIQLFRELVGVAQSDRDGDFCPDLLCVRRMQTPFTHLCNVQVDDCTRWTQHFCTCPVAVVWRAGRAHKQSNRPLPETLPAILMSQMHADHRVQPCVRLLHSELSHGGGSPHEVVFQNPAARLHPPWPCHDQMKLTHRNCRATHRVRVGSREGICRHHGHTNADAGGRQPVVDVRHRLDHSTSLAVMQASDRNRHHGSGSWQAAHMSVRAPGSMTTG